MRIYVRCLKTKTGDRIMGICTIIDTGNPIVDAVGRMNISGNTIPEAWYQTIVSENGKINSLAILVLADIVYWYRPTEIRDEQTLSVTFQKKFAADDFLQRSYEQLCDKFHITKRQARDVIICLEGLGVVKRHFKTITTPQGVFPNVMYLELVYSVLYELTYPDEGGINKFVDTPLQICRDVPTKSERGITKFVETNTYTTTENSTEISTTTIQKKKKNKSIGISKKEDVVVKAKALFSEFDLTDENVESIVIASGYDIERCKYVIALFDQQTRPIKNLVGWFVAALKDEYKNVPAKGKTVAFNKFSQRDYDFNQLEKALMNRSYVT